MDSLGEAREQAEGCVVRRLSGDSAGRGQQRSETTADGGLAAEYRVQASRWAVGEQSPVGLRRDLRGAEFCVFLECDSRAFEQTAGNVKDYFFSTATFRSRRRGRLKRIHRSVAAAVSIRRFSLLTIRCFEAVWTYTPPNGLYLR